MCDDDATETVHSTTGKLWLMTLWWALFRNKILHPCNNTVTSLHGTKVESSSSYYHNSNFHAPLPADTSSVAQTSNFPQFSDYACALINWAWQLYHVRLITHAPLQLSALQTAVGKESRIET